MRCLLKPVRKLPFGRSRIRWKDRIKVEFQGMGVDRISLDYEMNAPASSWMRSPEKRILTS